MALEGRLNFYLMPFTPPIVIGLGVGGGMYAVTSSMVWVVQSMLSVGYVLEL